MFELIGKPFLGRGIAVDEDGLVGIGLLHEFQKLVAGSMSAEVVDMHPAVERNLGKILIQSDRVTGLSGTDLSPRAVGVGIAYEEKHVFRFVDEPSCKTVGSGLFRHHAA